ncbi:MAG: hypothetical protein GEU74_06980 [Nitriliruptorales bacterium]|nr:hypothetical protein [Nitriliruptorales bacterium]
MEYRLRHGGTSTTRPDASPIVTVTLDPRSRTTIAVTAPADPVTAGDTATLVATLRRTDGTTVGGQTLTLHARQAPLTTWTKVAAQSTNAKGRVAFVHRPEGNVVYEVRHAGSATTLGSVSARPVVMVSFAVAIELSAATAAHASDVTLSGSIAPLPPVGVGTLWMKTGTGDWQEVQNLPYDSSGTFSVSLPDAHREFTSTGCRSPATTSTHRAPVGYAAWK